jgi:hypothetical protein
LTPITAISPFNCESYTKSLPDFSIWVDGSFSTRWKVFLGTTSCWGTAWPVSLGFSGLFDDFAFFGVLTVDIATLLEGFRYIRWVIRPFVLMR